MRAVVFPEREETECSERSYFQPQQGEGDSRPVRPPSGLGGPRKPTGAALLVTLSLLAAALLALHPRAKERKRPATPPQAVAVPASLADDEPHSLARLRADYARWRRELLHWLREGDPGLREARRLDPEVERRELPPVSAARACLQRHLMRPVTIDSLEPIGYERLPGGVAIDYRAVVRSRIDLYVVPALRLPLPKEMPEPVARIWSDLLFDAYLPPGCHHDVQHKHRLLRAGDPFVFRWRVERARVVDGQWKILLAAPSLLEWNCGFVAAEILALREGDGLALRLAGNRCLRPLEASFDQNWNELRFRYYATWGVPGAPRPAIAARAQEWLRATEPELFSSPRPMLAPETASALLRWTVASPGYAAQTDWAGRILAPVRALEPQDAESCFVAYYRELARERNRWIDAFLCQRAQIEQLKGKSPRPR